MPFSLVGWSQSQDTGGVLTEVAALVDQHITVQGNEVLVPDWAPALAGVMAIGATISQAQLSSPSLRKASLLDVSPINIGAEPLAPTPFLRLFDSLRVLDVGEGLRALVAETAAGAERETVVAWLQGEKTALPTGDVESIRLTGTTTLTANGWTLVVPTLSQSLRAGRYAILGFRAESAGLLAARLVIPGSPFRPGVIGYDLQADVEDTMFRRGGLGQSWGEFDHRFVPQVECLSVSADTAETFWLDIVKIA